LKDNVVILFTRIPVPGKTKTRLMPFLTGEECCLLQRAFLCDVFDVLRGVDAECDIVVAYEPEGDVPELIELLPGAKEYFPQHGGDLGERMLNAIDRMLTSGYGRCLLIGSDMPLLKPDFITGAFRSLDSHDIVLNPTEDGGYYLVGMKEPCEELFRLEKYGVSSVFEKTMAAAETSGKTVAVGAPTMDIDTPEDFIRLKERLEQEKQETCPETRKALKIMLN
jgi:hypothetical protein